MSPRVALLVSLVLTVSLLSGCAVSVTTRPASLRVQTVLVPTDKDDCKDGGWRELSTRGGEEFRNQGACISYVNGR